MKRFINKFAYVKARDIIAVFEFIVAIPFSIFLRIYFKYFIKNELWLICEDSNEARDNGYVFFKYLRENHPEIKAYYAINKKSVDYKKVVYYNNIIDYGGVTHWIYYLAAHKNISSHKGGKPNAAVCYFLEVYGLLKNTRVFLQHGVILNDTEWLYYKNTKIRLFVCGAYPEYQFVEKKFGYPPNHVKYLGLSRFDELHDITVNNRQILFMPSWRNWLSLPTKESYKFDDISDFKKSDYYKQCNEVLNNPKIIKFLKKKHLTMYFFPHRNMQMFIEHFNTTSENIIIAKSSEYDIQDMLKTSALMITDYSSVSVDFAYMKKPVIYFQFDKEKFRRGQYKEGYFDYSKDGFGPVCTKVENLLTEIEKFYYNNFYMDQYSLQNQKSFFKLYDTKNSERIYNAIRGL